MRRALTLGALVVSVAAPLAARGQSAVVYPAQSIPLRFDHGKHLALNLDCSWCHGAADTSVRTSDLLLPSEEICLDCHDPGDPEMPATACGDCHPGFEARSRSEGRHPARWSFPAARLNFAHRTHIEAEIECSECHRGMDRVGLATVAQLPRERACVGCHESRGVSTRCATCHLSGPDGLLRTEFPPEADAPRPPRRLETRLAPTRHVGRLVPRGFRGARHDAQWVQDHGPRASAEPTLCAACHEDRQCRGCHGGILRPARIHPGDWVTLHPLAARSAAMQCGSCHRRQTFCRDCHRRTKVVSRSEDPELSFPASSSFHPRGWVSFTGQGPDHHGQHARFNISACASCHSERTCIRCHAAAGGGGLQGSPVNPHPPGFSALCSSLMQRNSRACAKCHGDGFRCP